MGEKDAGLINSQVIHIGFGGCVFYVEKFEKRGYNILNKR